VKNVQTKVALPDFLKYFFISGVFVGFVAGLIYVALNIPKIGAFDAILAVVLSPLFHGLALVIYGLVGYPVCKKFFWSDSE
jgi:uncharacterized membrane protein YdcZ (DUF606 family)